MDTANRVVVYDPTVQDEKSRVRGIGRYLQILKENFPQWQFSSSLTPNSQLLPPNSTLINPFFSFLSPPLSLKRLANKQIAVIHDLIPLKYPDHFPIGIKGKLNIFLNKFALRNYDTIITDSEASKRDIVHMLHIAENKIKVIYPCLPKAFTQSSSLPNYQLLTTNYCIYVGDGTWNKNLSTIARAIKKTNVTCMFVGKIFADTNPDHYLHPWQANVKKFFEEAKDDKRFIFMGYVSDKELLNLYVQARLNILLSQDEGFGFSYLESASQGCPSLVSDIPIFHEIAGKNAEFVDCQDVDLIANALTALISDTKKLEFLSLGALEQSKKYSADSFKNRLLEVV